MASVSYKVSPVFTANKPFSQWVDEVRAWDMLTLKLRKGEHYRCLKKDRILSGTKCLVFLTCSKRCRCVYHTKVNREWKETVYGCEMYGLLQRRQRHHWQCIWIDRHQARVHIMRSTRRVSLVHFGKRRQYVYHNRERMEIVFSCKVCSVNLCKGGCHIMYHQEGVPQRATDIYIAWLIVTYELGWTIHILYVHLFKCLLYLLCYCFWLQYLLIITCHFGHHELLHIWPRSGSVYRW